MKTRRIGKIVFAVFILLLFVFAGIVFDSTKAFAEKKEVVIVLDPGHGGTDMGALTGGRMEKELNYTVAMACKRELEKYEGVKVYLTRGKDEELSLADRAKFASEKKADLVISLHFNASESHLLSGAETYVSSKQPLKSQAEKFALTELALLEQYGVPIHGNFTRLNENNQDYYGIIRESAARRMPTVIVEHCYLDVPAEAHFFDTPEDLQRFGMIDATAIAMTYGLRSKELGVDYSDIKKKGQILPQHVYRSDVTPPSVQCHFLDYDYNTKKALFEITLQDPDCPVSSFGISLDNGKTYSTFRNLYFEDKFQFEYIIKDCAEAEVLIGAYNAMGVFGYSNMLQMNDFVEVEVVEVMTSMDSSHALEKHMGILSFDYPIALIRKQNNIFYVVLFVITSCVGIVSSFVLMILKRNGLYL